MSILPFAHLLFKPWLKCSFRDPVRVGSLRYCMAISVGATFFGHVSFLLFRRLLSVKATIPFSATVTSRESEIKVRTMAKAASTVTARWSFSPGDLVKAEEAEDDIWGSLSAIPIDSEEDTSSSSFLSESEFRKYAVIPSNKPVDQDSSMVEGDTSPPLSPPDATMLSIENCFKEFKEMSLESPTSDRRKMLSSIHSPVRLSNAVRPSLRKQHSKRLSQSQHNRDYIRNSMKDLLNF